MFLPLFKMGVKSYNSYYRSRPGKQVNLTEQEVRGLCIKARDIFINQPILLELEAPIKICGKCAIQYTRNYTSEIGLKVIMNIVLCR